MADAPVTVDELALALCVPKRTVQDRALKGDWRFVLAPGKQRRRLYPVESLPDYVVDALVVHQSKNRPKQNRPTKALPVEVAHPGLYHDANHRDKETALLRFEVVTAISALIELGRTRSRALEIVAAERNIAPRSVARWYDTVKARPQSEWLDQLTPQWGGGRPVLAIDEDVIDLIVEDFLRLEAPSWEACYDRLVSQLRDTGIQVPSSKKLHAEINRRFTRAEQQMLRYGKRTAREDLLPSQRRTVANEHALSRVNGDGYKHNVMVKWPDGSVARPMVWYWQDVYSRKVLSWNITRTENTDQIRLSFLDLITQYGIPEHIHIDNTRAAANKIMTGGMRNRYRTKYIEGEPVGLFLLLGCKTHFTRVFYGAGNGRAKPIERMFSRQGGFGDRVDKHPAFQGAYTGPNTSEKPENYGSASVDLETFTQVLESCITAHNAKAKRRTEMGQGQRSYDQVFADSYAESVISMPTKEQLRLFALTAETVKVQASGKVTIKAGSARGIARNEYWSRTLRDHWAGKDVVARFDPANLHGSIYLYQKEGQYICEAELWEAAGFGDTRKAREYDRFTKQEMKSLADSIEAKRNKSSLVDIAEPPVMDEPRTFRPAATKLVPTPHLGAGKQAHEQTLSEAEQADVAAKVAQIGTELNALNNATEIVDRSNPTACVLLYGKLVCEVAAGIAVTAELQEFYRWFENDSGYMATYELLKDDIDFASGGLPKGRAVGAEKSPR
jgi:putative transposase